MNQHEEELQKNIEAGVKPVGDDPDLQAYQEVFSRLKPGTGSSFITCFCR